LIGRSTLRATILGVSVWGPGLEGWAASRPILAGEAPYQPRPSPPPAPALLAATERRRTGPVVRLALAVAHEAAHTCGVAPGALRSVFASSNGDGPVVGEILDALANARDERVVSPTQFHNSVHNAASGYWSIATASREPTTCIGCYDDSWAAGLLTALAELGAARAPVLLCCYDHPLPAPLDVTRPTGPPFAAALVLGPTAPGPLLTVQHDPERAATSALLPDPALEDLAWANPAARALPLLIALARAAPDRHELPYLEGRLSLELRP
jgi:hypothetical protein